MERMVVEFYVVVEASKSDIQKEIQALTQQPIAATGLADFNASFKPLVTEMASLP